MESSKPTINMKGFKAEAKAMCTTIVALNDAVFEYDVNQCEEPMFVLRDRRSDAAVMVVAALRVLGVQDLSVLHTLMLMGQSGHDARRALEKFYEDVEPETFGLAAYETIDYRAPERALDSVIHYRERIDEIKTRQEEAREARREARRNDIDDLYQFGQLTLDDAIARIKDEDLLPLPNRIQAAHQKRYYEAQAKLKKEQKIAEQAAKRAAKKLAAAEAKQKRQQELSARINKATKEDTAGLERNRRKLVKATSKLETAIGAINASAKPAKLKKPEIGVLKAQFAIAKKKYKKKIKKYSSNIASITKAEKQKPISPPSSPTPEPPSVAYDTPMIETPMIDTPKPKSKRALRRQRKREKTLIHSSSASPV